jgi:hypothetical protein
MGAYPDQSSQPDDLPIGSWLSACEPADGLMLVQLTMPARLLL